MKYTIITLLVLAALTASAQTSLEKHHEKRQSILAEKQAELDAASESDENYELLLGARNSAQNLLDKDEAGLETEFGSDWATKITVNHADLYISGELTFQTGIAAVYTKFEKPDHARVTDHIIAKDTIVEADAIAVEKTKVFKVGLMDRLAELAAFIPGGGEYKNSHYFALKNCKVLNKEKPGQWRKTMTLQDWFEYMTSASPISAKDYTACRNYIFGVATSLYSNQNRDLSAEQVETDLQPVADALNAPLFNGLAAAATDLGINLVIPDVDFSTQTAVANALITANELQTAYTTAWGEEVPHTDGIGSIMFLKGSADYEAWRSSLVIY